MSISPAPRNALRIGIAVLTALGVAGMLSRATDALWWHVLPWVLLAVFWILVIRHHRSGGPARRPPESGSPAS